MPALSSGGRPASQAPPRQVASPVIRVVAARTAKARPGLQADGVGEEGDAHLLYPGGHVHLEVPGRHGYEEDAGGAQADAPAAEGTQQQPQGDGGDTFFWFHM